MSRHRRAPHVPVAPAVEPVEPTVVEPEVPADAGPVVDDAVKDETPPELPVWQAPTPEENVATLDTDEAKVATVLPTLAPPSVAVHGDVTASGVRVIVPHVEPDPHVHLWKRGRRPDNSQTYWCQCGAERDR